MQIIPTSTEHCNQILRVSKHLIANFKVITGAAARSNDPKMLKWCEINGDLERRDHHDDDDVVVIS